MNTLKKFTISSIIAISSLNMVHAVNVPLVFNQVGIEVAYSDHGLWNNSVTGRGLEHDGVPISYPGAPWQQVSIVYDGISPLLGNFSSYDWGLQVPLVGYTGGGSFGDIGSTTLWNANDLRIIKEESWHDDGSVMKIEITVTNKSCNTINNFIFMHAVDPDQDRTTHGDFRTLNGVVPSEEFVFSAGIHSNKTVSYGVCDNAKQDVGHTGPSWAASPTSTFQVINQYSDYAMHIRHTEPTLAPNQTITFSFMFFVSDGIIGAFNDYNQHVNSVCHCVPSTTDVITSISSSSTTDVVTSISSSSTPTTTNNKKDYEYIQEKARLVDGIKKGKTPKAAGIFVNKTSSESNQDKQ